MPKQKDFKRLVRARMKKSGESYTTARRRILAKKNRSAAARKPVAPDPAALAGTSDAAVRAKTGRTWREWTRTLDAAGAAALPHRDIARLLAAEHGLGAWWSQTVTVGYERIRGLREKGQRRGGGARAGTYDANKSRTFPVSVRTLYRACRDASEWLHGVDATVRAATPSRSLRLRLADGTPVQLSFVAKGPAKSAVQIQHGGLPTRAAAQERKLFWAARLDALGERWKGRSRGSRA